jgi:hypothetical protein
MLVEHGQQASCVSIYPGTLIPFLDNKVNEEALLKAFLRTVSNMHLYALNDKQIIDEIARKASEAGYAKAYEEREEYRRIVLFTDVGKDKVVKSLVLLMSEKDKYSYCIEASGEMKEADVAQLKKISPEFLESYFKRFNIKL